MSKNLRSMLFRHLILCIFMAFLVPLILASFFSFAKNLFAPPAKYGISQPYPVMSIGDALRIGVRQDRNKIVLINNGFTGGNIDRVLNEVGTAIKDANSAVDIVHLSNETNLPLECRSTLRGVTRCFGAIVMRSSPNEGPGGIWNYTIRTDAAFYTSAVTININKNDNVEQVYLLPIQRTIDSIIGQDANPGSKTALDNIKEYPFTSLTSEERDTKVRELFHNAVINFMGVAFIANVIWITYHLTGIIASERESGMSQLIDAMMPVRWAFLGQAARFISHHLSFTLIYLPAWVIGSLIIRYGLFPNTNVAIVLIYQILAGASFASMSILFASFFKKAQLSGITATLSTLLLGILAQALTRPGTVPVAILSAIFAPCNYVFFIIHMARFEKRDVGANLTTIPKGSSWQLTGIVFWILMIIQIIVYPLIGAFVERGFYGTSTKGRKLVTGSSGEQAMGDNAVVLENFTKVYKPGFFTRFFAFGQAPEPVVAVNKLSFQAGRGQIICLLGANGSGKSTTLDAIAGLHKLTSGSITIDGTGGLGIAPQKNVLWDDLNVEEHLRIFNSLKSPNARATTEEIHALIKAIDLWPKRKALSKTLSGGQKRKLQLGMMLTGGSAVCCIDEVSSGLDPLSRRKIWDILLAERGKRTLILTTHFLDEADLLADHLAILSKGTLRAAGSSVELKDTLGGGYRVHAYKSSGEKATPSVPQVKKVDAFDMVTYTAPSSALAANVIKELEAVGIHDYRFSGPTIEDVFLQLAEEIRDEEIMRGGEKAVRASEKTPDETQSQGSASHRQGITLVDGQRIGYFKQARILFTKRLIILKRNWVLYFVAFILPIIAAALTSLYVKGKPQTGCSPLEQVSQSSTQDAFSQVKSDKLIMFVAGPSSAISQNNLLQLFQPILGGIKGVGSIAAGTALKNLKIVDSYTAFDDFIKSNRRNVTTGLWLGGDGVDPTFAWVGNLYLTSSLSAQQFMDVIRTNTSIATTWSSFDVPFNPGIGDALNLAIYIGLALSIYPAFFALYPSNERRRFVRALQYSNGVRPFPLWASYLLFDFIIVLLSSAIVTALWSGLSGIWYHIEYIFVVFFLYGLTSTLLSYIISLYAKSQLATFAWAAVGQCVCFLIYLIAYVCILTYVSVRKMDSAIHIAHFVISAVAPIGSAMRAVFLVTNLFSTACDGNELSSNPGGLLAYGGPILYLVVQAVILFGLLIWLDGGSPGSSIRSLFERHHDNATENDNDEEIANELARVNSDAGTHDGLRVMNLTKSFGKNTAVDNVTFGIKRGEVFALLGPNGAGKSTTISLIRGDLKPSHNGGDIFVEDKSVIKNIAAARQHLGVCPQIDAMDQMTVREHLEFYAKIRGIADVQHNVTAIMEAVGLTAFETRMAFALSGGNKRKLSLGIALMGNPAVVLLDEPSSGLDAASKRIMWKTLEATVPGRSILLTTHSMEEADALAGRAGIIARRMLALGTPDNLRRRFGDDLHVHLVSNTAPRTSDAEMERIMRWVQARLPSATVEDKSYHGQTRFSVRAADILALSGRDVSEKSLGSEDDADVNNTRETQSALGQLVVLLEEHKQELGISHFSVSPTTLDQVFLTIVGQHNVREENYEEKRRSAWKRACCIG